MASTGDERKATEQTPGDVEHVVSDIEPVRLTRVEEARTRRMVAVVATTTLSAATLITVVAVALLDRDPTPMVAAMAPIAYMTGALSNHIFPGKG